MKNTTIALILAAALLAGCGKNEESSTAAAPAQAPTAPAADPAVVAPAAEPAAAPAHSTSSLASSLTAKAEETIKAAMPEVKEAAAAVASSVDWANLSWNDISSVPYSSKDELVAWAAPQIDALKDKLGQAVKDKGMAGLASLGETGWQGALKKSVDALNTVRTASPETWQMATGALAGAWQTLQAEAMKYLE